METNIFAEKEGEISKSKVVTRNSLDGAIGENWRSPSRRIFVLKGIRVGKNNQFGVIQYFNGRIYEEQ